MLYTILYMYTFHVHLLSIHDRDVVTLHHASHEESKKRLWIYKLFVWISRPGQLSPLRFGDACINLFPSPSPSTSATIQPNLFSDISRHCTHKETRSLNRFRTGQICGTIHKYVRVHMRINKYREREGDSGQYKTTWMSQEDSKWLVSRL